MSNLNNAQQQSTEVNVIPSADNATLPPVNIPPPNSTIPNNNSPSTLSLGNVEKIAMKSVEYLPQNVEIWFVIMEANFKTAQISSEITKFTHVVSALPAAVLNNISDVIGVAAASDNAYERIKQVMLERYGKNENRRLRELLQEQELGDRTPSEFLRHLRALTPNGEASDAIIKQIWLRQLPGSTRMALTILEGTPLNELAKHADRLMEEYRQEINKVYAVQSLRNPHAGVTAANCQGEDILTNLTKQFSMFVAQINGRMGEIENSIRVTNERHVDHGRSRSRGRSASRHSTSRQRSPSNPSICWYHRKFGKEAQRCLLPCNFNSGNDPKHH